MFLKFDKRPILTLEVSPTSTVNAWHEKLNQIYTKEKLLSIICSLEPVFSTYDVMIGKKSIGPEYSQLLRKKAQSVKDVMCDFVARLLSTDANRQALFKAFSPTVQGLWRLVYDCYFISDEGVRAQMGLAARKRSRALLSPDLDDIKGAVAWFGALRTYWSQDAYFYMPATLRLYFASVFNRVDKEGLYADELPADRGLKLFSAETETIGLMPVLMSFFENGVLVRGNKKVGVNMVAKVSKLTGAAEFFPDAEEKADRTFRCALLVNAFYVYADIMYDRRRGFKGAKEPHGMIKEIFTDLSSYSSRSLFIIPMLFSRVTNAVSYGLNLIKIVQSLAGLLKEHASSSRWFLAEGYARLSKQEPGGMQNHLVFMPENVISANATNVRTGSSLRPDNLYAEAGEAVHLAYIALLASLGILEIAYTSAADDAPSAMSGLYAMRLTALGRYVMGIEKEYMPPTVEREQLFELDSERLIIRALGDNNVYEGLLKEFSAPIGQRRYVVTPDTFLSGCKNVDDIESKLRLFRQAVSDEYPEVWKEFFDRMLAATGKVTLPKEQYRGYCIDRSDAFLMNVLTTDAELRGIVRKVEGYMILVAEQDSERFDRRMRHFGYIV